MTALISIVLKRLRHQLGLTASALIGIVAVLSLVICVPIFTNAILSEILQTQLQEKAVKYHRSLFGLHAYYYDNSSYSPINLDGSQKISNYIAKVFANEMGLDVDRINYKLATRSLGWEPVRFQSSREPFEHIYLRITSDNLTPEKTRLVEGNWPTFSVDGNLIQVAVHEDFADDKFINVGDIYQSGDIQMEVTGIFRAIDPTDLAWFNDPTLTYKDEVWTPFETFTDQLPRLIVRPVDLATWYVVVDDASLRFNQSKDYARDMLRLESNLNVMVPDLHVDYSPLDMLQIYEQRLRSLTLLIYATGAPTLLLALLFTGLTASIAAQQVEQETLTMRGRGVSFRQVLLINGLESLLLLLIALPFAVCLGWLAALLMGQTELFLSFTWRRTMNLSLAEINLVWLLAACLVIVIARMTPLFGLAHTTIVNQKQERGRSSRKPFWERVYLDFLLLIPGIYAYFRLNQPTPPSGETASTSAGQYDPVLLFASSLFAIALCMILLRCWPYVMRGFSRLVERTPNTWLYLAIQEIARRPGDHREALLLIMISLSLSVYAASMARTLDRWLFDSVYYRDGADLVVREYEMPQDSSLPFTPPAAQSSPADLKPGEKAPQKVVESLVSLERHLQLPSIKQAAFVGRYDCKFSYAAGERDCALLGIDRLSFPGTAFFRDDFSSQSLGALMNGLASHPNGILVQQSFLDESGLKVGDLVKVSALIGLYDQNFVEELMIIGAYDLFPTVFPQREPTFIANLETLFGYPEAVTDYDVWLKLDENVDVQAVLEQLQQVTRRELIWIDVRSNARAEVDQMLGQPEWVGLFGVLNVGFILTGLMPGIGFLLYASASMRRRYIQIGILQAVGLSNRQMIGSLVLEQVFLMIAAIGGGALVGLVTGMMFLPNLQVGAATGTPVPPFEVVMGWGEAAWLCLAFGVVLLITIAGTIYNLVRIQIFQAVKMGEAL